MKPARVRNQESEPTNFLLEIGRHGSTMGKPARTDLRSADEDRTVAGALRCDVPVRYRTDPWNEVLWRTFDVNRSILSAVATCAGPPELTITFAAPLGIGRHSGHQAAAPSIAAAP